MYAVWYEQLGSAEQVLHFGEMEVPALGPDDVRVRVYTSGVNPSDVKRRSGASNIPLPFPRVIPQSDGAGVIEAVGTNVSPSRVGERVWLWNAQFGRPFGTAAEYVVLPSAQAVRLPEGITVHFVMVYLLPDAARKRGIADVNAALEVGALRPIIAARFPLREMVQAHQVVESGKLIGNVIVDIAEGAL